MREPIQEARPLHDAGVTVIGRSQRSQPSGVAVVGDATGGLVGWFLDGVSQRLEARGHPGPATARAGCASRSTPTCG